MEKNVCAVTSIETRALVYIVSHQYAIWYCAGLRGCVTQLVSTQVTLAYSMPAP